MDENLDLRRYGIRIPKTISPQQAGNLPTALPPMPQDIDEVNPKVFKKQKWFRDYNSMVQWKSQNGISDAMMVQMKRPYRGYLFQLHYNSRGVSNNSRGFQ